ncbi:hypothetical protein F5884DRAFT_798549 [Xylogone sp. PMI_703]|nr:hypothetical protein F5884DRAFT_798549 [Xylogone sp. PMI_703]
MIHYARRSGPYPSNTAGMGGVPTVTLDVPICAVFIFIYLCFAATNIKIFQDNRRRRRKFVLSGLLTGFSMSRIATLGLRIAWATRQHNVRIAIAAQILVNAGILLIYIINLILAQRILRALQPTIGWNSILRAAYKVLYVGIGGALAMVIASVVISVYTLNMHTRSTCRDIQLAALTYLLVFTCLPLIHLAAVLMLPKPRDAEQFGEGSMTGKLIIVTVSACLCLLTAGFKAGVNWTPPRLATDPAWFDSKACFYVFTFACEILILSLLTFSRIDKRFYIPDGCKRPGDYTLAKTADAGGD